MNKLGDDISSVHINRTDGHNFLTIVWRQCTDQMIDQVIQLLNLLLEIIFQSVFVTFFQTGKSDSDLLKCQV